MPTTLPAIIAVIYTTVEGLTPVYETDTPFRRYEGENFLEMLDPGEFFRIFRVYVVSVVKGGVNDSRDWRSKRARVDVVVNYPQQYQMDGDASFLGVEVIRPSDGALIENALCFRRPLPLQVPDGVRSIKWLQSVLSGRFWRVSLELEYLESIT